MTLDQRNLLEHILRTGPLDIGGNVLEQRPIFDSLLRSAPVPDDVRIEETEVGGVPVVRTETPGADSDRFVIYLHGGAYAIGSAAASVGTSSEIARRSNAHGISIGYRLAPEHVFPGAIEDVLSVYRQLLKDGIPASKIAFAGDSSGGGLAVASLVAMRDAGLPQPSCAVVFSPWADLSLSGASITTKAHLDPSLTAEGLKTRANDYLGGADPKTALASPVFADLSGLCPLLIQVGSREILLNDAFALAEAAAHAETALTLQVWPELPHVFQTFAPLVDEAGAALQQAGEFILTHSGQGQPS